MSMHHATDLYCIKSRTTDIRCDTEREFMLVTLYSWPCVAVLREGDLHASCSCLRGSQCLNNEKFLLLVLNLYYHRFILQIDQ